MNKWIAEFELENGDIMPEHMDLNYKGVKIDFHCKPLEQEPTTKINLEVDYISRQAVLRLLASSIGKSNIYLQTEVLRMSSVKSIRPKGHWIEEKNDYGEVTGWHCDKCYEDSGFTTTCKWDYCPNCGADMREVEE